MDNTEELIAEFKAIETEISDLYHRRAHVVSEALRLNTQDALMEKYGFAFRQRLMVDLELHRYASIIKGMWLDEGAYLALVHGMRMDDRLHINVRVNISAVMRREDGEWMSDTRRGYGSISLDVPLELALRLKGKSHVDRKD